MKREITVFEGWYDEEPGWEFDMPVCMMSPVTYYNPNCGSAECGIEDIIEDYMIAVSMGDKRDNDDEVDSRKKAFYTRVKNGKARKSAVYWKRVYEWDVPENQDDIDNYDDTNFANIKLLESVG